MDYNTFLIANFGSHCHMGIIRWINSQKYAAIVPSMSQN